MHPKKLNAKIVKYLHVFTDEKWTNTVAKQFIDSRVPNQEFIVILEENSTEIKYDIESKLPIRKIKYNSKEYSQLISLLDQYSSVFIHFLCELKFDLIEHVSASSNLIWMCWGQDIHKMIIPNSYMPETRKLLWRKGLKQEYFWKYTLWLRQLKYPFTRRGKILKKFDYCCPVISSDLSKTNKQLNLKIKYLPFHYSTLEAMLGKLIDGKSNGSNILIGNSSTYASNHLDVFNKLNGFTLSDRKIIVPLSYGDLTYGKEIELVGQELFNENFIPQKEYVNIDKYNEILNSCSIAIFNHIRQQALGNIIVCLWLGIRVYLNEKGALFKELKTMRLPVFSIQSDLVVGNKEALESMKEKDVHTTRKILLAEYGSHNTGVLTLNILKELDSHQKS